MRTEPRPTFTMYGTQQQHLNIKKKFHTVSWFSATWSDWLGVLLEVLVLEKVSTLMLESVLDGLSSLFWARLRFSVVDDWSIDGDWTTGSLADCGREFCWFIWRKRSIGVIKIISIFFICFKRSSMLILVKNLYWKWCSMGKILSKNQNQ